MKESATKGNVAILILVIAVLLLGGLYFVTKKSNAPIQPTQLPQTTPQNAAVTTGKTDTSNTSLDKDLQDIDTQLGKLNQSSQSIDQSLNDQTDNQQ